MFDYYFTYWDDLPEDTGFELFGITHITWLIVIAAGVICGIKYYMDSGLHRKRKIRYICAFVLILMEVYKYSVLIATGNMTFQHIPLHLCGMAVIIEVLYLFLSGKVFGELMCIVAMPGACAALIFPDWTRYPVINFMNIHSFIIHGILVMIPLMIMLSGEYTPEITNIYNVIIFFVVTIPIVYVINIWQNTNFMFLMQPSRDSPFENIYESYGYVTYMTVYGIVTVLVIALMYGIAKAVSVVVGSQIKLL
ncbi:MAG: TIGR02206 family membrane protein [Coprococcus sp.]